MDALKMLMSRSDSYRGPLRRFLPDINSRLSAVIIKLHLLQSDYEYSRARTRCAFGNGIYSCRLGRTSEASV